MIYGVIAIVVLSLLITILIEKKKREKEQQYQQMENGALRTLGFSNWRIIPFYDEEIVVKSRQALEKYNDVMFFKENRARLDQARKRWGRKKERAALLRNFLNNNEYRQDPQYDRLVHQINDTLENAGAYRIHIIYISSAGNYLGEKRIILRDAEFNKFETNPSLLMSKSEYNQMQKEQQKEALLQKQKQYYDSVNQLIDYANDKKDILFIKGSQAKLDGLISQLFDRTVNSIKKVKTVDSEEWGMIGGYISNTETELKAIVNQNQRILDYYASDDFRKIKDTCATLMNTQKDFNEYIQEKVESVSRLFGTRVTRNETTIDDEYQYIRPYKKTITPFTAEVSANVFASAENNPLDYVIKYFYPSKSSYPEQIQKLHLLIEELATLKDAKQIIDNYKAEYKQYLNDVPNYVMEEDEAGFYSRLGFANVDEGTLTVEYQFSYTSGGGMAKRAFTIPMTEETIIELIQALEGKLTASAFSKEQRSLMTNKLREHIKQRDNYTCKNCQNSINKEPNLLLEIDHIIPVSKGGYTVEDNLQTLCWKCNRAKSNKLLNEP